LLVEADVFYFTLIAIFMTAAQGHRTRASGDRRSSWLRSSSRRWRQKTTKRCA